MKLQFLGTNGWYSNKCGYTICSLLETKEYYIVFDAGEGIQNLDKFIKKDKPIFLFLSHLHLDHIFGFHIFPKFKFKNKVTIFCPKGTKKYLEKIICHPFANSFKEMQIKVSIKELNEGFHKIPFDIECRKILHIDLTFGYRINIDGKIVTHLCDTGICNNSKLLAKNADVLIHECSMKDGISDNVWGHSSSIGAAMVAKESKAKKLFLTHFDAKKFKTNAERKRAQSNARKIFKNTYFASDNMKIEI